MPFEIDDEIKLSFVISSSITLVLAVRLRKLFKLFKIKTFKKSFKSSESKSLILSPKLFQCIISFVGSSS